MLNIFNGPFFHCFDNKHQIESNPNIINVSVSLLNTVTLKLHKNLN